MSQSSGQEAPSFSKPDDQDLFLASEEHTYRYGDLKKFKAGFKEYLNELDFDFNASLAFAAGSSDELVFAIAACWSLGITFVPLNPESPGHTLREKLKIIKPDLLFTDQSQKFEKLTFCRLNSMDELGISNILKKRARQKKETGRSLPKVKLDDIFGCFFTSGTTGTAKIVPLKRRQMLFAAHGSAQNFRPMTNHYWLLCLPLNHVGGITVILRSLLYGSAIYRMDHFNADKVADYLSSDTKFQVASLVPTMLKRLFERQNFKTHQGMKAILLGGGPVNDHLVETSIARDIPVVTSYGMTETCAQIAANFITKHAEKNSPASTGYLFPPNQISIRDNHHKTMLANVSGHIWMKGPQLFDGYLNKNNHLPLNKDSWFDTGDFGYIDHDNKLFIEARRSDLIISGGENVSPFEVEALINQIPAVKASAVLGIPDAKWGQKVVAVVVFDQDQISTQAIKHRLAKQLEAYKIPKIIKRQDTVPRTHNGKIKRNQLIKLF